MSFPDLSNIWALLGGLSGVAVLAYMIGMLWFSHKRTAEVVELRSDLREIRGMILGLYRRR